ncbi:hypothetical protein Pelo_9680 [Pelomyxa schiedti]|nr:hypothetical protein Pelo_9680 [Pelomyxa schiedti]
MSQLSRTVDSSRIFLALNKAEPVAPLDLSVADAKHLICEIVKPHLQYEPEKVLHLQCLNAFKRFCFLEQNPYPNWVKEQLALEFGGTIGQKRLLDNPNELMRYVLADLEERREIFGLEALERVLRTYYGNLSKDLILMSLKGILQLVHRDHQRVTAIHSQLKAIN